MFNVVIYFWQGQTAALEFLTGYLIEKALSVDNLFVFALIFGMFAGPCKIPAPGRSKGVLVAPGEERGSSSARALPFSSNSTG